MQIVSYACAKGEKFRMQKNKTFKGHNTAGYACSVAFSPDARCACTRGHWQAGRVGRVVYT